MATQQTAHIVTRFESNTGVRIYRIPMQVFPNGFIGYSYLLLGAGVPTLVDTGSGFGESNDDLWKGLQTIAQEHEHTFNPTDIARILITHGHVDHHGGLAFIKDQVGAAQVAVHPLDRRVLSNHEERVIVATKDLGIFLERAGVREGRWDDLIRMYGFSKQHILSVPVDVSLEDGTEFDGLQFYHVPGHCSGQVAIRIGDVLLSADHILSRTSPHLAAESITHYTGLGHYRDSLDKIRKLDGIRVTLGGHEDPIDDLHGRIDALQVRIDEKLDLILGIIQEHGPLSIDEISKHRYREKHGFDVLLALQEAGAYVEYLYDRGYLGIANLDELEGERNPVLLYQVHQARQFVGKYDV